MHNSQLTVPDRIEAKIENVNGRLHRKACEPRDGQDACEKAQKRDELEPGGEAHAPEPE